MKNNLVKLKYAIIMISVVIFLISLTQNAFSYIDGGTKSAKSYELIISGGFAFLGGGLLETIVWLANPLFILSIFFLYESKKESMYAALGSVVLALSFLMWKKILVSESGRGGEIVSLDLGYWLWLSSLCVFAIGNLIYFISYNNAETNK